MNTVRNSPGRSPALAILGLVTAFALLGASGAQAAALTTKFDSNNAGSGSASGNTFDLVVKPASGVTVTGLDLNLIGDPGCVEVWTHHATSVGFEASSAGWTFQGAATVPAAGQDVPSPASISFFLPQGNYGVVILARDCAGGDVTMRYTDGGPTVFEDASLKLTTRKGTFEGFFTGGVGLNDPREWNGTIRYEVGSGSGVALFNDDAYVDAATDPPGGEVKNLEASLKAKGHAVTKFSLLSDAALNGALAGKEALLIPENEGGTVLATALTPAAKGAIQGFVNGGGQLIVLGQLGGRTGELLNSIFNIFEMDELNVSGTPDAPRRAGAAGTEFAGGPASLPANSATAAVTLDSLGQAGGTSIYDDGAYAWVATIPSGSGSITYLGWDWFNSNPPSGGGVDGGWQELLDRAIDRPSVTIADASVAEGDSGSTTATVTATLSQPVSEAVSVSYGTANETAAAGSDYTASSGMLTFPRGTTTQQISVPILGETAVEPDESFLVELSDPVATTLSSTSARVTIVNDDVDATTPPDTTAPALKILGKKLKLNRKRKVVAKLSCPASEASGPCQGKLKLKTRKRTRFKGKRRKVVLAKKRYKVPAGETKKVKPRLSKRKARLVRKRRKTRKIRAITRVRDQAGNKRKVVKKMKITIKRGRKGRRRA